MTTTHSAVMTSQSDDVMSHESRAFVTESRDFRSFNTRVCCKTSKCRQYRQCSGKCDSRLCYLSKAYTLGAHLPPVMRHWITLQVCDAWTVWSQTKRLRFQPPPFGQHPFILLGVIRDTWLWTTCSRSLLDCERCLQWTVGSRPTM